MEISIIDELICRESYIPPQEGLKQEELISIWRNSIWIFP